MERPGQWRGFGWTSFTVCAFRLGATTGSGLSLRSNSLSADRADVRAGGSRFVGPAQTSTIKLTHYPSRWSIAAPERVAGGGFGPPLKTNRAAPSSLGTCCTAQFSRNRKAIIPAPIEAMLEHLA